MPKITQLYAWVVADKDENDEGVPAFAMGEMVMPLMGADIQRAADLRDTAQDCADQINKPIKLLRSTGLEVVEVLEPKKK